MVSLSTNVKREEPASTKNKWLVSVIGVIFLVLFFGVMDMVLMLWIVVPLLFAEWSYRSKKTGTYPGKGEAEILAVIEEEIKQS